MEQLDRQLQRRVWARVYGSPTELFTPRQREQLRRCLQRCRENLAVYEKLQNHYAYREAFAHLADQTREEIKMLRQMLAR